MRDVRAALADNGGLVVAGCIPCGLAMIETEARVLSLDGESHAWVETRPHGSCALCEGGGGCKSVAISRLFATGQQRYRVANPVGAAAGDWVIVAVHEQVLLKSALAMYLLPVLALFAGAVLGAYWGELASVLLGGTAFAAMLLILRRMTANYTHRSDFEPAIIRVGSPRSGCRNRT